MTLSQTVKKRIEDDMVVISIDNPPVNALSLQVLEDLEKIFDELDRDDQVKGVVITGTGTNFSAGADIKAFSSASPDDAISISKIGQRVFNRIERFDRPVIAAVNGVALGGGNELTLACDIRISSDRARYSQPEVKLGLMPAWGGTQRLSRIVGKAKAKEMIFTGQTISAQEAYRIGLVNRVVPDGEELRASLDIIRQIASIAAPLAIKAVKRVIEAGSNMSSIEDAQNLEVEAMKELAGSQDLKEGLDGFLQKRQPKFQGK